MGPEQLEKRLKTYDIRIVNKDGTPYAGSIAGIIEPGAGPHEFLGKKMDRLEVVITLSLNSNHPAEAYEEAVAKLVEAGKIELQHPYRLVRDGENYWIEDAGDRKLT